MTISQEKLGLLVVLSIKQKIYYKIFIINSAYQKVIRQSLVTKLIVTLGYKIDCCQPYLIFFLLEVNFDKSIIGLYFLPYIPMFVNS